MSDCYFEACRPAIWEGRYARVAGKNSMFHLISYDGEYRPNILWETEDGKGTCWAQPSDPVRELSEAVRHGKGQTGGTSGAFTINEYGQVIVPSTSERGMQHIVGRWHGELRFASPFHDDGQYITLENIWDCEPGEPWKLPYIGIPHVMNAEGEICFRSENEEGKESESPPGPNKKIRKQFRAIRGSGGGRFIVTHTGLVLTKKEIHGVWKPFYVGKIKFKDWFPMESMGG